MFPDLTQCEINKEQSMTVTLTQTEVTFAWNGGIWIGAQAALLLDFTNAEQLKCRVTTGNSYSTTNERFKIYFVAAGSGYDPSVYIQTTSYMEVYEKYAERNAVHDFILDVSGLTGQHYMVFAAHGWNATFSNVELVEADTYTIIYNSNSGSGTMQNQIARVDEFVYLTPNAFTKAGYVFAGWALSASGTVVYQDGAEVVNLAEADETVTLYAVWERPSLKCKLQYNKSENNKAVKDIEDLREFNFKLKDPTSIIDPVLVITGDITDMLQANYMTIPVFGRSYFITNITSVRTGLVEISAHVDVLSSYIEYIRECSAIVHRQENKWNLYLDDGFFKTYQNPNIVVKKFPNGFTDQSFVLAVAGN